MKKKPQLFSRLHEHFSADPADLPVLEQSYAFYERANLHLAIGDLLQSANGSPSLTGIVVTEDYQSVSLSKLSRPATATRDYNLT